MGEQIPSREQLAKIVCITQHLVQTATDTFSITDQVDPPEFPCGARPLLTVRAIIKLERALNPNCVLFGHNGRYSVTVSGWSQAHKLGTALTWLQGLHDRIIVAWSLQAICDRELGAIGPPGAILSKEYFENDAIITVEKDWPPKIDRDILDGMATAASRIAEILEGNPDGGPVDPPPEEESEPSNGKKRGRRQGSDANTKAAPAIPRDSDDRLSLVDLKDPIPVVEVVRVVGRKAGRSDKLAEKMQRHNYRVVKSARKWYCQREDAIALFRHHRQRIEEIE